jgi:hypothetical protein
MRFRTMFSMAVVVAATGFFVGFSPPLSAENGCGSGMECYSVPSGCGEGIGCFKIMCVMEECPAILKDLDDCFICDTPD